MLKDEKIKGFIRFGIFEEEILFRYAEDKKEPTATVYPYVPIERVEDVIKKHGGIKTI